MECGSNDNTSTVRVSDILKEKNRNERWAVPPDRHILNLAAVYLV